MSDLCDKIERRLGTKPLNLPEEVCKDKWPGIIAKDTIDTFSRYFPRKIKIILTPEMKKNGWYYIDKDLPDNIEILGIQDIDWSSFAVDSLGAAQCAGYGFYDTITVGGMLGATDILTLQAAATHSSMYNNGIYLEEELPNKIRFKNVTNGIINIDNFPITVLVKHSPNLMTISQTMMETFERLAIADVATFIYEYLKYYNNVDTVFANVDFKLDDIGAKANTRDDIVAKLEESYVNPANTAQPCIICQ
jgi:hypothetical protein